MSSPIFDGIWVAEAELGCSRDSSGQNEERSAWQREQQTPTRGLPGREVEKDDGNGDSSKSPQAYGAGSATATLVVSKCLSVRQLIVGERFLFGGLRAHGHLGVVVRGHCDGEQQRA